MSTSILKALPGKLDIKRHSPSILYLLFVVFASIVCGRIVFLFCDMVVGFLSSLAIILLRWRNRGSYIYMSAHVLLNLLNELGKRDKMRGSQRV